ncbi:hypothetical protein AGMMS50268_39940 [Spirochaetia bacterium]|nr:hypothetical protein AGMMS50268_39940 [Spirochaetia bacterium]
MKKGETILIIILVASVVILALFLFQYINISKIFGDFIWIS